MTLLQGIILGLVEGLTEFIPVSSSGHLILARDVLHLAVPEGLAVDAVLQLATMMAVIVYFRKDLWSLIKTLLRLLSGHVVDVRDKRLLYALILGTIPAVVFGLLLEAKMETVFRNAELVAWSLLAGAVIFIFAEWIARVYQTKARTQTEVTVTQGITIGFCQALALIPGLSRSGMTISGGLILGLTRFEAARFGFLLSLPVIAGSGAKKLLDLSTTGTLGGELGVPLLVAALVACVTGLITINFLLRFLKTNSLIPFAVYRIVLALIVFWTLS